MTLENGAAWFLVNTSHSLKEIQKIFNSGQKQKSYTIKMSMLKCADPIPSSAVDFQRRVIGKGTTSVMENSRTLNAGDKMAHCKQTQQHKSHKCINSMGGYAFFTNPLMFE